VDLTPTAKRGPEFSMRTRSREAVDDVSGAAFIIYTGQLYDEDGITRSMRCRPW